ncbi:type II secretion system secretin GspD [Haliangium ochraceum]|nr:type II secretion system secretin GspD [Haliangium ochraceum]
MSKKRRTRASCRRLAPGMLLTCALALALILAPTLSPVLAPTLAPMLGSVAHAQPTNNQQGSDDLTDEGLYSCGKARGPVSVSFKPEVELKDLITWAMGFTCRNFVYGAGIGGRSSQVTIIAPKRMTPQQAWGVFLVALETMNLTVVPHGNVLTIVESAQAGKQPLPIYRRGAPAANAQLVRMVVRPEHLPAEELARALDGLKSQHGAVTPLASANMLIVTDYGHTISRMRTLIREVDQPLAGERLYLIRVRNADATEMATKLQEILGVQEQGRQASSPPTSRTRRRRGDRDAEVQVDSGDASEVSAAVPSKIIPDERTNSLILVSSQAAYQRVRSLIERLDVGIDGGGSGRIHVYPLEHGNAEEIANTLTSAISGISQQTTGAGARNNPRARNARAQTGDSGAPAFEGQVRVTHDAPTNALVIVASVKDFFALRDVIEKLDTPRRQVFIEAMILEVQTDSGLDLGASFHGGQLSDDGTLLLGGLQTSDLQSIVPGTLAASSGLLGGVLGPLLNTQELLGVSIPSFGVLFQALATSSNVNVLSSPHIVTTNNEEAEISVGQNIPYQSGLSGLPTAGTGVSFPVQSVQRQDVALTLKITPHINASDMVTLEIDQEISDIASPDFAGLGPSWSKRTVKTTVVVRDQQSIVIGGLMSDRMTYNESKVPLLGDLPLLGYFFKFTERQKSKTNLLILLTPYVIKGQMDIEQIVQRKTRESQEFARTFSNLERTPFRPEIDYRRKRGLIEEINRTAQSVERDAELLRAATQSENEMREGLIEYVPPSVNVEGGVEFEGGAEVQGGGGAEVEVEVEGEGGERSQAPASGDGAAAAQPSAQVPAE